MRASSRGTSLSRGSRSQGSFDDDGEPKKKKKKQKEHPYDKVFGKHITHYLEEEKGQKKLTISWLEYRSIKWPHVFPDFIVDLIEYLTGFEIIQFLEDRNSKKEEEKN